MSDLISRQVAIDALQKEINKGIPPFDDVMGSIRCGVRLARNIIEDLPSAQPHWIPCGDRLPKKDGLYLCWYEYYHWSKEKVLPEYGIGYYDVKLKLWGGEVANGKDAKVLAWMPLPDPYKGE